MYSIDVKKIITNVKKDVFMGFSEISIIGTAAVKAWISCLVTNLLSRWLEKRG